MTNLLNQALNRKPATSSRVEPNFTVDSNGKVKPLAYKGQLLPSKIFGSPIEYVKDLKQDIVNIGRAANGNSNDHELGRINDVATKIGSLAIASYLAIKNPLKLDKTMQFIGFGSFFASMALLPKLLIQAPIKARTGVDIHQKYVDSQGRKKMLFQDPQYDLTDLYSREDLDRIGKKLKVSENLPDRDAYIKQRAKKTATQGNTLWMMSAGAAPIAGALMSSGLEKVANKVLEVKDLHFTEKALNSRISSPNAISSYVAHFDKSSFNKFIEANKDKALDSKMAKEIATKLSKDVNSAVIQSAIEKELLEMSVASKFDLKFVQSSLKDVVSKSVFDGLSEVQQNALNKAIESNSFKGVADILANATTGSKREQAKMSSKIVSVLKSSKTKVDVPKISDISNSIENLRNQVVEFAHNKKLLDNYISARVGDKSGSYIANQWGRFTKSAIKALGLSSKELKQLSQGNSAILEQKLSELASNPEKYDKVITKLGELITDYDAKTGKAFTDTVKDKASQICRTARTGFKSQGLHNIADRITKPSSAPEAEVIGTLENIINTNARERVSGARSSFFRYIQALDIFKKAQDGSLKDKLATALTAIKLGVDETKIGKMSLEQLEALVKDKKLSVDFSGIKDLAGDKMAEALSTKRKEVLSAVKPLIEREKLPLDSSTIQRLTKACKKVVLSATTTDYVEKLKSSGFELSEAEFKTVMKVLFESGADDKLGEVAKAGFDAYKKEAISKLANWENGITPQLQRRVVGAATNSANAVERNNLVGKPVKGMIQDAAKQLYNSNKWLKIFGVAFGVIAAATITAGLFMGRKEKAELEAEAQSKTNG